MKTIVRVTDVEHGPDRAAPNRGALVYKIVAREEWSAACAAGELRGSTVDLRDGFVHLSSAAQVAETARRHFARMRDLVLLALDADACGPALRWEPSRGGELFPHLYASLDPAQVAWSRALPLGDDGEHVFPRSLVVGARDLTASERARVETLLERVVEWARASAAVDAVLLVGSHARGTAVAGSDVDLVILAGEATALVEDPGWPACFGTVTNSAIERWGALTSVRVRYDDGLEVELGTAQPSWAAVDPVEPGTREVLVGGARPLHDPRGLLRALLEATLRSAQPPR